MNFRVWIMALIAIAFVATLFAEPSSTTPSQGQGSSSNQYGAVVVDTIESVGVLKLQGTTVTQLLSVNGSLLSQGAHIARLDVWGEANFTDTTIKGEGRIAGYLQAHKTRFEQPLILTSQKAIFVASELKGISFRKDPVFKGKQILELKQRTVVDGPISFEGGKGEVHLYSGSQLLGPVTGGKVLRK